MLEDLSFFVNMLIPDKILHILGTQDVGNYFEISKLLYSKLNNGF